MFKVFTVLVVALCLTTPVHAATNSHDMSATYETLQAMVRNLQAQLDVLLAKRGDAELCRQFSYDMRFGSTDQNTAGQVTWLQKFLIRTGHLSSDSATGYFGPKTQQAVQSWQAGRGLITSGTPDTTGFGIVGLMTRNSLEKACAQMANETAGATDLDAPIVDITNITNARNPVVTGIVRNAQIHRVIVYEGVNSLTITLTDDDIVYSSDNISDKEITISDERWWDTVEESLEDGQYTFDVYFSPKGSSKESHVTEVFSVAVPQ